MGHVTAKHAEAPSPRDSLPKTLALGTNSTRVRHWISSTILIPLACVHMSQASMGVGCQLLLPTYMHTPKNVHTGIHISQTELWVH